MGSRTLRRRNSTVGACHLALGEALAQSLCSKGSGFEQGGWSHACIENRTTNSHQLQLGALANCVESIEVRINSRRSIELNKRRKSVSLQRLYHSQVSQLHRSRRRSARKDGATSISSGILVKTVENLRPRRSTFKPRVSRRYGLG